ncbi:MAG: rhamnulokinase [Oscillospiraceae bacterium]|nr:rhamnulokinase [Oscillospiraceae bacterium]
MQYYLAIDIGASSGRHIVGWREDGKLCTKEVYRFPNGVGRENGHLVWDMDTLEAHVRKGIDEAKAQFGVIRSLSIDTWGIDYVLLRGDKPVKPCYAYRDGRGASRVDEVHAIVPFSELYRRTGSQFQPFNTIYQLYDDLKEGRLAGVTDFLMVPEYLLYRLCGVKAKEFTNASTTGLLSASTREYDREITDVLGLPAHLFTPLAKPGARLGQYAGIDVVLCATHDTASAVEGIEMKEDAPYISSGTWSLLGVKTAHALTDEKSASENWSNEAGPDYVRYQKNIMGMWLVNNLRAELCPDKSFEEIALDAQKTRFSHLIDADSADFLAPQSMREAFDRHLPHPPKCVGGYFRCAYRSLAASYARSIAQLEENTGKQYDALYIVGGGAKNAYLNELTAEATGHRVIALPIEATALGNLKIQMEADK